MICVLMVVSIHTDPFLSLNQAFNSLFVDWICRIAVPFFFIATGYFLFRDNPSIEEEQKICRYIVRIFRMYIIWCVIYSPVIILKNHHSGNALENIKSILYDLIIIGPFQLWYLLATAIGVLISFGILKVIKKWSVILFVSIFVYMSGLLLQTYNGVLASMPYLKQFVYAYEKLFSTTRNGFFFAFPCIVFGSYISRTSQKESVIRKRVCLLLLISMALYIIEYIIVEKFELAYMYDMWIFSITTAALLFILSLSFNSNIEEKHLRHIRKMCTLIFLVHRFWVTILKRIFVFISNSNISCYYIFTNSMVFYIFVLFISIVTGEAILFLSERHDMIKKLYT